MRRKVFRVLLTILAVQAIASVVGMFLSKRLTKGDEATDEFQVAAILGGKRFESHASHLRAGTAIASMGGIELDLREATLDPEGAELELKATMGGIRITVPADWAVDVDTESTAGGCELDLTAPEDLPEDAPRLHIHAIARMGGALVTSRAS